MTLAVLNYQKILTTKNTEDHGEARSGVDESDDETPQSFFEAGGVKIQ
jgi:hypothetical protein